MSYPVLILHYLNSATFLNSYKDKQVLWVGPTMGELENCFIFMSRFIVMNSYMRSSLRSAFLLLLDEDRR